MSRWMTLLLCLSSPVFAGQAKPPQKAQALSMPSGGEGIGFDDLGFAPGLRKVLVPGGRTGKLFLVDPETRRISGIAGFSADASYKGGHGEGTTSADEGAGLLFATDRNTKTVAVIDTATRKIIASAALVGVPDYVRFAAATHELWVSEPDSQQIEVFSLSKDGGKSLTKAASIAVPGGPESLVIESAGSRAYTHLWKGGSVAIDLKTRAIGGRWPNGCAGSRGIALDEKRGFLFAGCDEGKAVVLDVNHGGKILGSIESGSGVDVIAYNPSLAHLYLPGANSATMAILAVSEQGALSLVRTVETAKGSHCVAADDRGNAWVCDPDKGRLLRFKDAAKM